MLQQENSNDNNNNDKLLKLLIEKEEIIINQKKQLIEKQEIILNQQLKIEKLQSQILKLQPIPILNETLFYKVFHNIVIFKIILNHLKLYKENRVVKFYNKIKLLEYPYREYISTIKYHDHQHIRGDNDTLEIGDLPIVTDGADAILKRIEFKKFGVVEKGEAIPQGVEFIKYPFNYNNGKATPVSTLPSTVHTIKHAVIIDVNEKIPSNVTTLSINRSPPLNVDINSTGNMFSIPATVKKLKFSKQWYNDNNLLKKGDIPDGITSLDLGNYNRAFYQGKGVFPESIKYLCVGSLTESLYSIVKTDYSNFFKYLPPNLETLKIGTHIIIKSNFNLKSLKSLKNLSIQFDNRVGEYNNHDGTIQPNSLPPNIINLFLSNLNGDLKENSIPNSVTNLTLLSIENILKRAIPNSVLSITIDRPYSGNAILPQSLTHLKFYNEDNGNIDDAMVNEVSLNKMIKSLPLSVNTLTLPLHFKKRFQLKFPLNIKNINYVKDKLLSI